MQDVFVLVKKNDESMSNNLLKIYWSFMLRIKLWFMNNNYWMNVLFLDEF